MNLGRPTPAQRVEAARARRRFDKFKKLKQRHCRVVDRRRIAHALAGSARLTARERILSAYQQEFQDIKMRYKARLKERYFYEQWQRKYLHYQHTLRSIYRCMDKNGDETLSRHEIFRAIILDTRWNHEPWETHTCTASGGCSGSKAI